MSENLVPITEKLKNEMQASILALLQSDAKVVTVEQIREALFRVVDKPEIGLRCRAIAVDQVKRTVSIQVEHPSDQSQLIKWTGWTEDAMKVREFEFLGHHVEVHFNAVYSKFFWTIGTSPLRFDGACEYWASVDLCGANAKHELSRLSIEPPEIMRHPDETDDEFKSRARLHFGITDSPQTHE